MQKMFAKNDPHRCSNVGSQKNMNPPASPSWTFKDENACWS